MSKTIGYLEGVDSTLLTALHARGYHTLPLSNGFDSHGQNITLLSPGDNVSLVISYFHKLMPPDTGPKPQDLLHRTTSYEVPVLVICQTGLQSQAKELFGELPSNVKFVDPAEMHDIALSMLDS
jgi:hypothetical protein